LLSSSSSAPFPSSRSSDHPPLKSNRGELPGNLLSLSDLFPAQIWRRRRRFASAPPQALGAPRAHAAGRPARAPQADAVRLAAASPREPRRRRLTLPPPPAGPERLCAAAPLPQRRRGPLRTRALLRRRVRRPAGLPWPRAVQAAPPVCRGRARTPPPPPCGRRASHGRGTGETEEGGGPGVPDV